jgi:hypothetical protein
VSQAGPAPPRERPASRLAEAIDGGATPPRALAAALAWSLAVAPAAFARGGSTGAKTLGIAALLCGLAGPFLVPMGRSLARHVGISAFLALNVAAWLLGRSAIGTERLEPVRAGLGALAFGVWSLAWGDVFRAGRVAPPGESVPLPARSRLPALAVPIAAISVVAGLAVVALAWRIADPPRALAGHAAALAAGVAMVTAGATLAISRGGRRDAQSRIPGEARRSIALLVVVAVVGVATLALRGGG